MPDTTRRNAMASRSRAVRSHANELMDRLQDNGLKTMLRVSVLHPLDDIDGLFLGDPKDRPTMALHEDMWLTNAEQVLGIAEREYERLAKTIAAYGGAERARTIG